MATEQQIFTEPLISRWTVPEIPRIISDDGWELVIYEWMIGPEATILLYSLSGVESKKLLSDVNFSIQDDLGNTNRLLEMLPLAEVGDLECGVMNFQVRQQGATKLNLEMTSSADGKTLHEQLLAYFDQVLEYQTDRPGTTYFFAKEGDWKQAGYKLLFLGVGVPNHLPVPGVVLESVEGMAEPVADARAPWAELPPGVSVTMLATLQIENLETGYIDYLAMQFLTGRGVLAYFQGEVVSAIPTPSAVVPLIDNPYPTP